MIIFNKIFDLIKGVRGSTKAGHLWIKREGVPGDYTYWYKMPNGQLVSSKSPNGIMHGEKGKPMPKPKKQYEVPEDKEPKLNLQDEKKKRITETRDPDAPAKGTNPEKRIKNNPILKLNAPKKPFSLDNDEVPANLVKERIEMAMTNTQLQGNILKDNLKLFANQARKISNGDENLEQELYSEGLMAALAYMRKPSSKLIEKLNSGENLTMRDYRQGILGASKAQMHDFIRKQSRERKGLNAEGEEVVKQTYQKKYEKQYGTSESLNQPLTSNPENGNLEDVFGTRDASSYLDIQGFYDSLNGYLADSPLRQSMFKYMQINSGLPFLITAGKGKEKEAERWREQLIQDLEDPEKQKMYGLSGSPFKEGATQRVKEELLTQSYQAIKLYALIELHEQEEETRSLFFSNDRWQELEASLISGLNLEKINKTQKMGIQKYFEIQTKDEAQKFKKEQEQLENARLALKQVQKIKNRIASPVLIKKSEDDPEDDKKMKAKNFKKFAESYINTLEQYGEALQLADQSKKASKPMKKSNAIKLVFFKTTDAEVMDHPNKLGAGAKKRKKLKGKDKIRVVLKEFKRGTLHSGSGEIVTNRKQALSIALHEAGFSKKS